MKECALILMYSHFVEVGQSLTTTGAFLDSTGAFAPVVNMLTEALGLVGQDHRYTGCPEIDCTLSICPYLAHAPAKPVREGRDPTPGHPSVSVDHVTQQVT